MTNTELELGGIVPDRPMQSGDSHVPREVTLEEGTIHWNLYSIKPIRPGVGLLARFVELENASDEEIFQYARKWGVLGICKHGLPASHNNFPFGRQWGTDACIPLPSRVRGYTYAEPTQYWRDLSRRIKAVQSLGAQINQNQKGDQSIWRQIQDTFIHDPPWQTLATARRTLTEELNGFLAIGQVRPRVEWHSKKKRWQIELAAQSVPNLFGLIAHNLLLSVTGSGLVICSSCHKSFVPERRPDPGRRNYCSACGKRAAQRDAARDYRQRNRLVR
jgi:hypothetical protein